MGPRAMSTHTVVPHVQDVSLIESTSMQDMDSANLSTLLDTIEKRRNRTDTLNRQTHAYNWTDYSLFSKDKRVLTLHIALFFY